MSLTFNGTSDYIKLDVGTSTAFAVGTHSLAFCAKKRAAASDALNMTVLGSTTSAQNVTVAEHLLYGVSGHNGQLCIYQDLPAPTTRYGATPTAMMAADGWEIGGMDKASGTNLPRFHSYNFGTTTQAHENSIAGTVADSTTATGSGGFFTIGRDAGTVSDYFDGDIAWVALWDGTQLSDADYVSMQTGLSAVAALSPTHLWVMTTSSIVDSSSNSATEVSRSGTVAGSTPPTGHSTLVPTTPDTPVTPTAVQYAGKAIVTWPVPYNGDSAITSYTLQASVNGGSYGTVATPSVASDTVTGLTPYASYTFKVLATNSVGSSSYSSASAAVAPYGVGEVFLFTDGTANVNTDGTGDLIS